MAEEESRRTVMPMRNRPPVKHGQDDTNVLSIHRSLYESGRKRKWRKKTANEDGFEGDNRLESMLSEL